MAVERGMAVAAPVSLKTQLSRWENQHAVPEEHYRTLLCALYDVTEAELGLGEQPGAEQAAAQSQSAGDEYQLRLELAESVALGVEETALLRDQLAATRRLDHRMGTAASAGTAKAQLTHLERLLIHAVRPAIRRELARLVADSALLVGEHARDGARPAEAWRHFGAAKAAALHAESAVLAGCAMVWQAMILLELGEHLLGAELIEQALDLTDGSAPGPVVAWFEATRGLAWAQDGAAEQARSVYRLAEEQLNLPNAGFELSFPKAPFLTFDLAALARHRGHTELILGDDETAIAALEQSLSCAEGAVRDIAGTHIDLAHAYGALGQAQVAGLHASQAREIVTRISSLRLARHLDQSYPTAVAPKLTTGHQRPEN